MRNITCESCGKRYDYDQEESCPNCGAFNRPQAAGVRASAVSERPTAPRAAAPRQSMARPAVNKNERPGQPSLRPARGKGKNSNAKIAVIAVAAVVILNVLGLVIGMAGSYFTTSSAKAEPVVKSEARTMPEKPPEIAQMKPGPFGEGNLPGPSGNAPGQARPEAGEKPAPGEPPAAEKPDIQEIAQYNFQNEFSEMSGVTLKINCGGVIDRELLGGAIRDTEQCLFLDFTAEVTDREAADASFIMEPYLMVDGVEYQATGMSNLLDMSRFTQLDMYALNANNGGENEAAGQLFFFIPADATGIKVCWQADNGDFQMALFPLPE